MILLVGDTYGPLVDLDGEGELEGAAALRYDLRAGFLSVARPLLPRRFFDGAFALRSRGKITFIFGRGGFITGRFQHLLHYHVG